MHYGINGRGQMYFALPGSLECGMNPDTMYMNYLKNIT
jgi:hypothetical protein